MKLDGPPGPLRWTAGRAVSGLSGRSLIDGREKIGFLSQPASPDVREAVEDETPGKRSSNDEAQRRSMVMKYSILTLALALAPLSVAQADTTPLTRSGATETTVTRYRPRLAYCRWSNNWNNNYRPRMAYCWWNNNNESWNNNNFWWNNNNNSWNNNNFWWNNNNWTNNNSWRNNNSRNVTSNYRTSPRHRR
jgi:hypothetical protein